MAQQNIKKGNTKKSFSFSIRNSFELGIVNIYYYCCGQLKRDDSIR